MSYSDLELLLLKHIQADNYRPVKPRVITKQLGFPESRRPEVRKAIKRLAKRGVISYGSNHLVQAVQAASGKQQKSSHEIMGIFQRTAGGFGFVKPRPTIPGQRATPTAPKMPDIYIPARRSSDAATGDLVRVRLGKPRRESGEDRLRGEIVEVVERETHQFVGTYKPRGDLPLVQIDGRVFAKPIPVGDPGAKNVRPEDKVVIEMIRFPSHLHDGEAVIVEVLGPRGSPGVDTLLVIREFGLPDAFPEEVLESARQQADAFDPTQFDQRQDLTELIVVTIDPADARDFDDAISLEQLENGYWQLGVHIADVAHFVPINSPLDHEARNEEPVSTCLTE